MILLALGVTVFAVIVALTACVVVPGGALYRQIFPGEGQEECFGGWCDFLSSSFKSRLCWLDFQEIPTKSCVLETWMTVFACLHVILEILRLTSTLGSVSGKRSNFEVSV